MDEVWLVATTHWFVEAHTKIYFTQVIVKGESSADMILYKKFHVSGHFWTSLFQAWCVCAFVPIIMILCVMVVYEVTGTCKTAWDFVKMYPVGWQEHCKLMQKCENKFSFLCATGAQCGSADRVLDHRITTPLCFGYHLNQFHYHHRPQYPHHHSYHNLAGQNCL